VDDGKTNVLPYLLFGFITVIYGVSIFFFLPYSLLQLNLTLLLGIFFAILLGMIFGLTLISYNFQYLFEYLVVKILLCWERQSMKQLILKNLVAHKQKN
jgi:hypothetical protein